MSRNERLFEQAKKVMPGGVSSPVRAFKTVGGTPLTIRRGRGAWVWDADGRRYLDFVCAWGALTLGIPDSPGVPALWAAMTFTAPTNDLASMGALLTQHAERVAAVIVEPVVGNAGLIPPDAEWLAGLRELTNGIGALLVLDEV